jgi:MerR family transcriptional regulator/heat shock protein HspR
LNIDKNKPIYTISVAAEILNVHPRTLRIYEEEGLVKPQRTGGNTRMYSQSDIELIAHIRELTQDKGVNLAGVKIILEQEKLLQQQERKTLDKIISRLNNDKHLGDVNIDVDYAGGTVTLSGKVFDRKQKEAAEMLARAVEGVNEVKSDLAIAEPQYDTLTELEVISSRNIQIIAAIRDALDYHPSLNASAIKVISAKRPGVFYLRGYVLTPDDRAVAEELAMKTSGVRYIINDLVADEDFVEAAENRLESRSKGKRGVPSRSLTEKYVIGSANKSVLVSLRDALNRNKRLDASDIKVIAEPFEIGIFHLTGTVPKEEHKELAEEIARRVSGVRYIVNELDVQPRE